MEHALLGFLRLRPMYGYELHRHLSDPQGLGLVWKMKQSHLYALLAKLEAAGYITAVMEPQPHRPSRKVFRLTKAGARAYRTWIRSPVPQARSMRQEFMLKLHFAGLEGGSLAVDLVERQREACQGWLRMQQEALDQTGGKRSFPGLVRSFRQSQLEAMLGWLDLCQQTLPAIQPRT
jgi:DNA-binding PadR family transcriptional regulator